MTKTLEVRPDDDDSITLSHACNTYGLQRFRFYDNAKNEYIIAKDRYNNFYLVNTRSNHVCDIFKFQTNKDAIRRLLEELKFNVVVVIEEQD